MRICENCGRHFESWVTYFHCTGCGEPLPARSRLPSTSVQRKCVGDDKHPGCGNELLPGDDFCGMCGAEGAKLPHIAQFPQPLAPLSAKMGSKPASQTTPGISTLAS